MRLHREVSIPDALRDARLFVRLVQDDAETLRLKSALGPSDATHQVIDAAGRPLVTHLSERDETISGSLMRQNVWECLESLVLLSVARPGMTFVDIGANVGYYSVLLARSLQHAGQIHAFEPEPNNTQVLTANALLTREIDPLAARITVWGVALSDRSGPASLNIHRGNLGLHSLVTQGPDVVGQREVTTTTLDALRFPEEETSPRIDRRIDLLKVDTQGCEGKILRGGQRTLARDRPLLCLGFEPSLAGAASCRELVHALEDLGYHSFRLFHATLNETYRSLLELGESLTADDVLARVERQQVGPYGTLLAYPATVP
jgi:FkbM family methyltransferase